MKKLLIVDDEASVREFLVNFFEEKGFEVKGASDGKMALELLEKETPNLILLDIQMPRLDGLSALKQIKSRYPEIKVMMLSGVDVQEKIEEALHLGADHYVIKPFSLAYLEKEVCGRIHSLLGIDS